MKKIVSDFKVTLLEKITDNCTLLHLKIQSSSLPKILPGQFVNIWVGNRSDVFLRRPISICDVIDTETIAILVKNVGKASNLICNAKVGDIFNLMIPLGNGFSDPQKESSKILLIGGGVGIAPLYYLAKHLVSLNHEVMALLGASSINDVFLHSQFEKVCKSYFTTLDGSLGKRGFVTEHEIIKEKFDKIYSCGPLPMLKNVARIADVKSVDCEVSLENRMACGIGACLCCVEDTVDGNLCVCKEGPVFNIKDLKW